MVKGQLQRISLLNILAGQDWDRSVLNGQVCVFKIGYNLSNIREWLELMWYGEPGLTIIMPYFRDFP